MDNFHLFIFFRLVTQPSFANSPLTSKFKQLRNYLLVYMKFTSFEHTSVYAYLPIYLSFIYLKYFAITYCLSLTSLFSITLKRG